MSIGPSIRTLVALAAFTLLAPAAAAVAGTCAGLSGPALSSCRQYCNKIRCQAGSTDPRCASLRARFVKVTGLCQLPCDCGNGSTSACEQCDDGNGVDGDACTNQCTANVCGDGSVLAGVEACDDGNNSNGDGCRNDCTVNTCGDGFIWAGVEACDDGNASNDDGCKNDCTENTCGDGVVRTGVEACDDGNASNADACKNDCTANTCGDGWVHTGVEGCDDGNLNDNDACRSNCVESSCGDGVLWYGVEQCDDANFLDDDACKTDCTENSCGDGVLETGVEECDDGDDDSRDPCKTDCTLNVCGDGYVNEGIEVCDNGGWPYDQACTANCELPDLVSPIQDDLTYCGIATTDRFQFPVVQGELVEVSVDTVDAETAADLCAWMVCEDATEYSGDNEVDCTFAPPGGTSCPSISFSAPGDTTCRLDVGVCEGGCADEFTGKYVLNVLRSGQPATLVFARDDD